MYIYIYDIYVYTYKYIYVYIRYIYIHIDIHTYIYICCQVGPRVKKINFRGQKLSWPPTWSQNLKHSLHSVHS